ncbi:MAG TPA: tetratricopeptide repeat protein [Thermotogota bacterium]|nr:tetratricopeptide repeat protein [Thermotogota bacterium]
MPNQSNERNKYVFISYSHHELPEVARRLKTDLEALGYEVFLDIDRIAAGGHWDATLNEGLQRLKDGGWFVFLMTPSSVRQSHNFCLNEVTWASYHTRDAILPLRLVSCEPPLTIYTIQYYPIDDAIPIEEKEERYREHLKEIEAFLSRKKTVPVQDERIRLKQILQPMEFEPKRLAVLDRFMGREWVLDGVKKWLQAPNAPRIFRIGGGPGTGKSAIAAWLVREIPDSIRAIHFCDRNNTDKSNVNRIIHSIACQLAFCLEDYGRELKDKVFKDEKQYLNPVIQPRVLFEELIADPLVRVSRTQRNENQQIVILIDGLDEAGVPGRENELARLIGDPELQKAMPTWIRWIITSRNEPLITFQLQGTPIQIDLDEEENQRADFRAYYEKRLSDLHKEPMKEYLLETLVNRAERSFLYCELMCDDIVRNPGMLRSPEKFPVGMNGYLSRFFSAHFPQGFDDRTIEILSLMCAAVEPLKSDLIRKITGMKKPELKNWLRAVGSLIQNEEKTDTLRFYHASVPEWLTGELEGSQPDIYEIEPEEGHRMLADYGWEYLQRAQRWEEPLDYAIENLGIHLYASSKEQEKDVAVRDRLVELFKKSFAGERVESLPEEIIDALLTYVVARYKESEETGFKGIVDHFLEIETDAKAKHALTDFLHNRYDYDIEHGNAEWARWMLQRQHLVLEKLVDAYPENIDWLRDLSVSWSKIGDIEAARGNLSQARDAYEKDLALMLELTAKDPTNTLWKQGIGVSWIKIGDIEKARGNLSQARDAYEKALAIMLELTAKDPTNTDWHWHLGVSWNRIGNSEEAQGNLSQAHDAYEKYLAIMLELTKKDPANTGWLRDLSVSWNNIGVSEAALGNLSQARDAYEKALAIMLELATKDPTNTKWQRDLAVSWNRIGDIEAARGNLSQARDAYEKALEIMRELTEKDPSNTGWLHDLSVSWSKIADIEAKRGNLSQARDAYEKALAIMLELTAKDPTNTEWHWLLGVSWKTFGDIEAKRGNLSQARDAYEKALAIMLELTAKDPTNTDWHWRLGVSWNRIGNSEEVQGNLSQAHDAYEKALEIMRELTEKDPANTGWLHNLSANLNRIGDIEEKRGNLKQARDAYEKDLAIMLELATKDPTNTKWQRNLGVSWSKIGDIEETQGNLPQARDAYEKALAIMHGLAAKDPANTHWKRELSLSWTRIGDIEAARGNLSQALDAYEKDLAIILKLTKIDPTNTDWLRDLSASWNNIGDIEAKRGNLSQARDAYEKALAIRLELSEIDPTNAIRKKDLGVSWNKIGDIEAARENLDQALVAYEKQQNIMLELAEIAPTNTDWKRYLGVSWNNIADVEAKRGNIDRALEAYNKSLAIRLELTEKDPENLRWQLDYSISLSGIGKLYQQKGEFPRSKECFLQVLDILRTLVAKAPDMVDSTIELAFALLDLYQVSENEVEKQAYHVEAAQIAKSLVDAGAQHRDLNTLLNRLSIDR